MYLRHRRSLAGAIVGAAVSVAGSESARAVLPVGVRWTSASEQFMAKRHEPHDADGVAVLGRTRARVSPAEARVGVAGVRGCLRRCVDCGRGGLVSPADSHPGLNAPPLLALDVHESPGSRGCDRDAATAVR